MNFAMTLVFWVGLEIAQRIEWLRNFVFFGILR
jgi:hypothetical protein